MSPSFETHHIYTSFLTIDNINFYFFRFSLRLKIHYPIPNPKSLIPYLLSLILYPISIESNMARYKNIGFEEFQSELSVSDCVCDSVDFLSIEVLMHLKIDKALFFWYQKQILEKICKNISIDLDMAKL